VCLFSQVSVLSPLSISDFFFPLYIFFAPLFPPPPFQKLTTHFCFTFRFLFFFFFTPPFFCWSIMARAALFLSSPFLRAGHMGNTRPLSLFLIFFLPERSSSGGGTFAFFPGLWLSCYFYAVSNGSPLFPFFSCVFNLGTPRIPMPPGLFLISFSGPGI